MKLPNEATQKLVQNVFDSMTSGWVSGEPTPMEAEAIDAFHLELTKAVAAVPLWGARRDTSRGAPIITTIQGRNVFCANDLTPQEYEIQEALLSAFQTGVAMGMNLYEKVHRRKQSLDKAAASLAKAMHRVVLEQGDQIGQTGKFGITGNVTTLMKMVPHTVVENQFNAVWFGRALGHLADTGQGHPLNIERMRRGNLLHWRISIPMSPELVAHKGLPLAQAPKAPPKA